MRFSRLIFSSALVLLAAPATAQNDSNIAVYDLQELPAGEGVTVERNLPPGIDEIPPGEGEMDELPRPSETPGKPPRAGEEPPLPDELSTPLTPQEIPAPEPPKLFTAVKLQGLNKVTARNSSFEAPLGTVSQFGNLEIIARRCWQAPPTEQPENAALLEIREIKPGEAPQTVFSGWMFSSSPGLSALEHPVYDITVLECTMGGGDEP